MQLNDAREATFNENLTFEDDIVNQDAELS